MAQKILLASHGSPGARVAEQTVYEKLNYGDYLFHLIVVPDFWEGMQGDDWLNNASTRDVFADYVETTLGSEVSYEIERVRRSIERLGKAIKLESRMDFGNPVECLLLAIRDSTPDIVIMGGQRPKNVQGLRSSMLTKQLLRSASVPIMVIPYPINSQVQSGILLNT